MPTFQLTDLVSGKLVTCKVGALDHELLIQFDGHTININADSDEIIIDLHTHIKGDEWEVVGLSSFRPEEEF